MYPFDSPFTTVGQPMSGVIECHFATWLVLIQLGAFLASLIALFLLDGRRTRERRWPAWMFPVSWRNGAKRIEDRDAAPGRDADHRFQRHGESGAAPGR
jgi:hypothetical protein